MKKIITINPNSKTDDTKPLIQSNFKRPYQTFTERLQNNDDMTKRLANYEEIDDIETVLINTHVRYLGLNQNHELAFRLGGLLKCIKPQYVMLTNGKFTWSVQRYFYDKEDPDDEPIFETKFYRVLSKKRRLEQKYIKELEEELDIKNSRIAQLETAVIKLSQKLRIFENQYNIQ